MTIIGKEDSKGSKIKSKKDGLQKLILYKRGYNKYLKLEGEVTINIDYNKFNRDAVWDGLKGYITNTKLTYKEVIDNYNNLWHIEKAFRMSKTDLRIRPIYHSLRHRIEAHICISFTAYCIYKELERVLYTGEAFTFSKNMIMKFLNN
jgi:transposase